MDYADEKQFGRQINLRACTKNKMPDRMNMIVKLRRKNSRYPDLNHRQNYVVIGIEADDFRLLNDHGRPYLYPSRLFEVVDFHEPQSWVTTYGDDGERYAYPPPLNAQGFFEDFFDDASNAVAAFWRVLNQNLAVASTAAHGVRRKSLSPAKARMGSRAVRQLAL